MLHANAPVGGLPIGPGRTTAPVLCSGLSFAPRTVGPLTPRMHACVWRVQVAPELYPYGSRGPVGAHYLAAKYNVRWGDVADADNE